MRESVLRSHSLDDLAADRLQKISVLFIAGQIVPLSKCPLESWEEKKSVVCPAATAFTD